MGGMKGILYRGLLTVRETSCLTKLIIISEVGMEGSKFTGTVQNCCVFSPSFITVVRWNLKARSWWV